MSSEQILISKKTTIKTRRKDKVNSNKEIDKEGAKQRKEGQSQKIKLPPIIQDPDKNSENILETNDNNSNNFTVYIKLINSEAKEITNYYLDLHKDMLNTYNSIYSEILQNNSGSIGIYFLLTLNNSQIINKK